jgi:cysteine-rich repeat protein
MGSSRHPSKALAASALASVLVLAGCDDGPGPADAAGVIDGGDGSVDAGSDAGARDAGVDASLDAGPPPPGDTCAEAVDVNAEGTTGSDGVIRIHGDNFAARHDLDVCDPSPPTDTLADVVYVYTPDADGTLRWELERTTPTLLTIDVRSTCDDADSGLQCDQCPVRCIADLPMTAGEPVFFVISGVRTTGSPDAMGEFDLRLTPIAFLEAGEACDPTMTEPACRPGLGCQDEGGATPVCGPCGDGFLGFGLFVCDDGNTTPGDGCSATCEVDDQSPGGPSCAAATTLRLVSARVGAEVIEYATARGDVVAGSDVSVSCATGAGPEAVYAFDLAVASDVEVSATGADALGLYRVDGTTCGTEIQCMADAGTPLVMASGLAAGSYLVVVDRTAPSAAAGTACSVEVIAQAL